MRRLGLTVVGAGGSFFLGTRDREGASNPSCVALRGRVGGPSCCAIYRSRLMNCRKFDLGSSYCKAARKEAGLLVCRFEAWFCKSSCQKSARACGFCGGLGPLASE
jgi:hypothetical protein